jgi:hypothetical protein
MDTYTGIVCDRCGAELQRYQYIELDGECQDCFSAHVESYETDGLGMGEWNAEIPEA